jgi:hypothetical protein
MTADRTALEFLGFIFGGVTAVVMLVALAVVVQHDGKPALDSASVTIAQQAGVTVAQQ